MASKFMDIVVCRITQDFDDVHSYVDDLHVPQEYSEEVPQEMLKYGLATKPAESASEACILGLQLSPVLARYHGHIRLMLTFR